MVKNLTITDAKGLRGKKKNIRRVRAVALLPAALVSLFVLTGCGETYDRTTFVLKRDGSVEQYIVEEAEDDVSIRELEEYAEDGIEAYHSAHPDTKIELRECDIRDGSVYMELEYPSAADYAAFNDVVCFDGTITEAAQAGYAVPDVLTLPDGTAADLQTVLAGQEDGLRVLVLAEPCAVRLPGKLAAYGTGVTADENGMIEIQEDGDETLPEEFRATNRNNAYLLYSDS